jgi:hypothetical protein
VDAIDSFLEAFRLQSQLATGLATVGLGAIIYSWVRIYGVVLTKDMNNFRQPLWLAVPAVLFILSYVLAYVISGIITGYYFEIADGVDQQSHKSITDAVQHFRDQYAFIMQPIGSVQLTLSVLGVLIVAGWYMSNVFATSKRMRG